MDNIKDKLKNKKVKLVKKKDNIKDLLKKSALNNSNFSIQDSYDTSTKLYKKKMQKEDVYMYDALSSVQKGDISVIKGCYDNIENLLNLSEIPFEILPKLKSSKDLNNTKILFVNCNKNVRNISKGLEKFVKEGGFLVSTDWAINLYPKYIGNIYHDKKHTSEDVVSIDYHDDSSFYTKNVFPKGIKPNWWLEGSSKGIGIKGQDVDVLMKSSEMYDKYGTENIGVTFPYEKGRVFHFISHFILQKTKDNSNGNFAKDVLDLDDDDLEDIDIRGNYNQIESAYTSAAIIHNIIGAKMMGYDGR